MAEKAQETARRPLSNAERQCRFRKRRAARLRELEALRNEAGPSAVPPFRNAGSAPETADDLIDDALTTLRKRGDQLVADYERLLVTAPGLTAVETQTINARFMAWRQRFDSSAKLSRLAGAPELVTLTRSTRTTAARNAVALPSSASVAAATARLFLRVRIAYPGARSAS